MASRFLRTEKATRRHIGSSGNTLQTLHMGFTCETHCCRTAAGPKIFRRLKQALGIYLASRNRHNPADAEQEQQDCFLLSSGEEKDPYLEAGIPELANEISGGHQLQEKGDVFKY